MREAIENVSRSETIKSLKDFELLSPLIDNDSTMNMLCHYMEEKVQEIKENWELRRLLKQMFLLLRPNLWMEKSLFL